jgi:hypothetical protein
MHLDAFLAQFSHVSSRAADILSSLLIASISPSAATGETKKSFDKRRDQIRWRAQLCLIKVRVCACGHSKTQKQKALPRKDQLIKPGNQKRFHSIGPLVKYFHCCYWKKMFAPFF